MKRIIYMTLLTSILTFLGCKSENEKFLEKHNIIYFGSPEFQKFEAEAPIKLQKAWEIQKEYARNNNQNPKNWLFFIIDNNYAFTSIFQPKIPEASTGGVWIDSKTGQAKKVETKINIRYKNAYNGDGKEFLF